MVEHSPPYREHLWAVAVCPPTVSIRDPIFGHVCTGRVGQNDGMQSSALVPANKVLRWAPTMWGRANRYKR
jgi:hypothetical protein